MYGAALGDMIGAPYEFDRSEKTKDFPLFTAESTYTDDTVMTVAVAEALMDSEGESDKEIQKCIAETMLRWGRKYPKSGYSAQYLRWLFKDHKPIDVDTVDAAISISCIGWLYDTIDETRKMARLSAMTTHVNPDSIRGADAVASVVYMARTGSTKEEIKDYVQRIFGYDLSRSCAEIRKTYEHQESCKETVPQAITAFLESKNFEDALRTVISLGGNTDSSGAMTGAMASAYYIIPVDLIAECRHRLPEDMLEVVDRFETLLAQKRRKSAGHGRAFQKITRYLDDLDRLGVGTWAITARKKDEDAEIEASYSAAGQSFMRTIEDFKAAHPELKLDDFRDILWESHITWSAKSMSEAEVGNLDSRTIMALLVAAVEAEKSYGGSLTEFMRNGSVRRWLIRLKKLDDDGLGEIQAPRIIPEKEMASHVNHKVRLYLWTGEDIAGFFGAYVSTEERVGKGAILFRQDGHAGYREIREDTIKRIEDLEV